MKFFAVEKCCPTLLLILTVMVAGSAQGAGSADLWQARNGAATLSIDPVEWVKGNAGQANSHYIEGYSIPYRVVVTGASLDAHRLVLEWDTTQNGKHAIDYITHFNRLLPHDQFSTHQQPEAIDPLQDVIGPFSESKGSAIPVPSSADSPVVGQPGASFAALPAGERTVTIWNGTITGLSYLHEDSPSADAGATQLAIEFVADAPTVVIAFGGHIASKSDWGVDDSATSIGGSPYHMRMISFDGSGGNQDRSVNVLAVASPPTCMIAGPATICARTTNTYSATSDAATRLGYRWTLTNNTSGAQIIGPADNRSVQVAAANAGSFDLEAVVSANGLSGACSVTISVEAATAATPLIDQTVCLGGSVTFSTTPSGTGPFAFTWRKDGVVISGATSSALTIESIASSDAGVYSIEVKGTCGSVTATATLRVELALRIACPADLAVQCFGDLPPPAPDGVTVLSGSGQVTVRHAGDVAVTNGCEIRIARAYAANDACGAEVMCTQTIVVHDTTPPVLTCAPDRTVECGAAWDFDAPSATDNCPGIIPLVAVTRTTTNQLVGNAFAVTRTWLATDACGNTAPCSQTITVTDTTPPVVVCPANITVPCSGPTGGQVTFAAQATDVCDPNVPLICIPPSGSIFPIGVTTVTCAATDANGNRGECHFTVTVRDLIPPEIVCPASFTVLEEPAGSGSALVTFPAPTATDNCDANPVVVCDPPSGSRLTVGDHVVTCTVRDGSGNNSTCTFSIKVVPQIIVANSTGDSGPGSLRQALLDANAAPGTNVIHFAFAGSPPFIIHLLTPLPPLGDAVIIDGWSQLQFTGLPVIEIDGTNLVVSPLDPAGDRVGLVLAAGGTLVRGLTLNGFTVGIRAEGPGGNVIEGNLIGTDIAGNSAVPNTGDGILLLSPGNRVGGSSPEVRNVISGNRGSGIRIWGTNAIGNVIRANFIGIAANGAAPLGNGQHGVRLGAGAAGNIIGGSQPGEGNVIAFNGGSGVLLDPDAGTGNLVLGNAIFSNGGLGIDLGGDGTTQNDDGDVDGGPNGLQNSPALSFAQSLGDATTVAGTLVGVPNSTYLVEFFLNSPGDASGAAPAQLSMGTIAVETDANGNQNFSASFPIAATAVQSVTATATDAGNNTSEFSAPAPVDTPPVILVQPAGVRTEVGVPVILCVTAIGGQPLLYQWRLNGANVPDATNHCLMIPDVQVTNGGSYTVVIANDLGIVLSEAAPLSLIFGNGVVGDDFADRVLLVNANGIKSGNNSSATLEPGEPLHGGKPGGKSIWYTWTPPGTGIATFGTAGSTFDTLLAVYSGSNLVSLLPEASDEDGGGFYTSGKSFNVFPTLVYQIAIDGLGGASGDFLISWTFEPTRDLLPVITNQPVSKTVASGATVTFDVGAFGTCREVDHDCRHLDKDAHPQQPDPQRVVSYQWYFNGTAIPGATRPTLIISNVQENSVGLYYAQVTTDDRSVRSEPALLQINETGGTVQNVQARDKYLDEVYSNPIRLGTPPPFSSGTAAAGGFQPASTVVRGYTGTQVFNTAGSSTEAGEEPICGVMGGASQWISFVADETGTVFLNTDGSGYDTVIAVFTRMTNSPMLQLLGCDNNSGLDGRDSAVVVPVQGGRTNFIVIDGVNGATGVLRLNYSLVTSTLLTPIGVTAEGNSRVRVSGRPNLSFTLQRSANLQTWSSLVTTNAPSGAFEFIDAGSAGLPSRFYRALVLP